EGVLAHIDDIKVRGAERLKQALREHAGTLRLSRQLVRLEEDLQTPVTLDELRAGEPRSEELRALLTELEFVRLLQRLAPTSSARAAAPPEGAPPAATPGLQGAAATGPAAPEGPGLALVPPQIIATEDALRSLAVALRARAAGGLAIALQLGGPD